MQSMSRASTCAMPHHLLASCMHLVENVHYHIPTHAHAHSWHSTEIVCINAILDKGPTLWIFLKTSSHDALRGDQDLTWECQQMQESLYLMAWVLLGYFQLYLRFQSFNQHLEIVFELYLRLNRRRNWSAKLAAEFQVTADASIVPADSWICSAEPDSCQNWAVNLKCNQDTQLWSGRSELSKRRCEAKVQLSFTALKCQHCKISLQQ